MMDRESKREKIISDKMREVKLRMRTTEQKKDAPEETSSQIEKRLTDENRMVIETTEQNFYKKIEDEEKKRRVRYFGGPNLVYVIFYTKLIRNFSLTESNDDENED